MSLRGVDTSRRSRDPNPMTSGRTAVHDRPMARVVRDIGLARLGFGVAAWVFVACVVLQVVLVGFEVFARLGGTIHRDFAYLYGWIAPVLVLLAAMARVPTATRAMTILLLVLFAVQTVLPSLRDQVPFLAALHTVNALAIFGLAVAIARRSTAWIRERPGPEPWTPG